MIVFRDTIGQMCVDSRKKETKESNKILTFNRNFETCESSTNNNALVNWIKNLINILYI